jgi:hypothetical protein
MILCSLILQLQDGSVVLYLKTIDEDGLEIITAGIQKPRTVDEFVQAWRNQIWDYGYTGWFKGKEAYTRTKAFVHSVSPGVLSIGMHCDGERSV